MAFDYYSTISPFNLDAVMEGSDRPAPLPDVSWASQPMESYTPTGNGSGQFIDTATQNGIFGTLDKVLNWAIQKDSAKIQQDTQLQLADRQGNSVNTMLGYQAQQAQANRKLMLMGLMAAGLFLVMRK